MINKPGMGTLVLLPLLILIHCGPFRRDKQTESSETSEYQLAWVHPRVVLADAKFTLITAERIDSFIADIRPTPGEESPSVVFEVTASQCQVNVDLGEVYGAFRITLIGRNLPYGFYKLTLNPELFSIEELPSGQYYLTASACGEEARTKFFHK